MQQAHARVERAEDDYSERRPSQPALQAVAALEARMDEAAFQRHVGATERSAERRGAGEPSTAPTDIRTARRERGSDRALREFEVELGVEEALYAPRHRPRRPTGAAADYARGDSSTTRRTIRISGHGAPTTGLRPTPSERRGPRPDRVAAWAFAFAVFLAVLALITG